MNTKNEVKKRLMAKVISLFVLLIAFAAVVGASALVSNKAENAVISGKIESVSENKTSSGTKYDRPIISIKTGVGVLVQGGANHGASFRLKIDSGKTPVEITYNYVNGEYFLPVREIESQILNNWNLLVNGYKIEISMYFYNVGDGQYSNSDIIWGADTFYNYDVMSGFVGGGIYLDGDIITVTAPSEEERSYDLYLEFYTYNANYSGVTYENFTWDNCPFGNKLQINLEPLGDLAWGVSLDPDTQIQGNLANLNLPQGKYVIALVGDRNLMLYAPYVIYNVGQVLPEAPYKNGYEFVGWYMDEQLTQPYNGHPIYADTNFYAKFNPVSYTITYNLNGGTLTGQATTYNVETNTFALATPTKSGYSFGGWYDNATFSNSVITQITKGSMGNKAYWAKWNVVPYTITYNLNGGTLTGQATNYNIESADITLLNPTKSGYEFKGWYDNTAFAGDVITKIAHGSIGNKELHAKFEIINYNINYHLDGGTLESAISYYTIETNTITLPIPLKTGYDFKGWYDNAEFNGLQTSSILKGTIGNKNYYAKFDIQTFKIKFYVDGAEYMTMTVNYGTKLVDLYLVDMATMQAVAFSTDMTMKTSFDLSSLITSDIDLFADTNFSVYAGLTYDIDGERTTDLLDYNSTLNDLRTPEKSGYTFEGWYYDDTYTHQVKSTDKITANTIVFAKFSLIEKEEEATFIQTLVEFFKTWWWTLAVGAVVIVGGGILFKKKKG